MAKVSGLTVDFNSGEGEFVCPPKIKNENPLFKLDVLSDWILDMEAEKTIAVGEYFLELISESKKLPTFEHCFSVMQTVLSSLDININNDEHRESCENVYIEYKIKKEQK